MADILNQIIAIGGTTAHRERFNEHRILSEFIQPKLAISCFVAVDDGRLVGFQSLEWSDPDWPGDDRLPADWAIIATYIHPRAQGGGIGSDLFRRTASAAQEAGVRFVDATIRKENKGGLAFYTKLSFVDYRDSAETISKRFSPA